MTRHDDHSKRLCEVSLDWSRDPFKMVRTCSHPRLNFYASRLQILSLLCSSILHETAFGSRPSRIYPCQSTHTHTHLENVKFKSLPMH